MSLDDSLKKELLNLDQQSLYRQRKIIDGPQQVHLISNGKPVVSFCSNDYLGLANHPDIAKAFKQGVNDYGVGSGAAHLVSGHSRVHHELEEALAEYTGRSRALLFSTGYMANLGIVNALMGKGDIVFQDKLNHASLIDAALLSSALSGSQLKRYPHNDMNRLAQLLAASGNNSESFAENKPRKLVMTDAVFSMDGDLAEVSQMSELCQQHNAWLMLDDAHGFGVLGANGAGTAEEFSLDQEQLPVYMATLGKAMGGFGAFVAGSDALIETLIQKARAYVYTTAMLPAVAQALLMSIKISREESWRREKLKQLIAQFRLGAEQLGLSLMNSQTAIQPVMVGDNDTAMSISQTLEQQGILITAIRPPTVPKGTARLRVTLSAEHEETDIEQLLSALARVNWSSVN
ncbi:MAG: 8-amino-7-oxononanoate synthase [gamma proteobacterium symbiont of Lucinoma myriamae]|nr:8-amino-7-oxononanoate synthase [gamma proteobacterium symbiont of Lucinoma myriamae]MCU7817533.1 8-amino-7-oxononanoate synthase [gamma proteobacterium symbiont of Lucinoma myriamae]MCU7831189.1 8-amino-7-oxononanoate synthase [gamma proteobacterium symbiont of Lucinoma myriamae]